MVTRPNSEWQSARTAVPSGTPTDTVPSWLDRSRNPSYASRTLTEPASVWADTVPVVERMRTERVGGDAAGWGA